MIIYTEMYGEKIVYITPYKENSTDNLYRSFDRSIILCSTKIVLCDLRHDTYYTTKNRHGAIDRGWKRGTIFDNIRDSSFKLATLYSGNELVDTNGTSTGFKSIDVGSESCENIEEYLRCLDEIYSNI